MKTLSGLFEQQNVEASLIDAETPQPTQSLVLFNGVLDGEKLLQSPEIGVLVNHFYGGLALTFAEVENTDKLHDWARDEQYKADVQERAMIYHVKAPFENLKLDTSSDQFSGPLYVQVFHPDGFVYDVFTITCFWNDGLFRNDYYVVGVIADSKDLRTILGKKIKTL